jgi:hypothetical protein
LTVFPLFASLASAIGSRLLTAHCRSQTNFFPRIGHICRVATAMPTLAAGGPPPVRGKSGSLTLAGVITAVMVQVTGSNPMVREYVGQTLGLQTTSSTRYLLKTDTGTVPITFADLTIGQKVSASGMVANNVWTAMRITVGADLIHLP